MPAERGTWVCLFAGDGAIAAGWSEARPGWNQRQLWSLELAYFPQRPVVVALVKAQAFAEDGKQVF